MNFVTSLCPVCKTIFYFLLLAYMTGIQAQYQRSCSLGEVGGNRRESGDAWLIAIRFAEHALQQAIEATSQMAACDYIQADKVANDASESLSKVSFDLCRTLKTVS